MFLGFMAIAHSLIVVAGTPLILGAAEPLTLGLAVLGSQLPDLLSSFLEDRFPHRSITQSLLATAAIVAVSLPVAKGLAEGNASSILAGVGCSEGRKILLKTHGIEG